MNVTPSGQPGSLRDQIAEAVSATISAVAAGLIDPTEADPIIADDVLAVLARDPWGQWTRAESSSSPPELPDNLAPHIGPHRGRCGLCGHPDARHREVDAALSMTTAGDTPEEADTDFGWPTGTTDALIGGWRPDDWQETPAEHLERTFAAGMAYPIDHSVFTGEPSPCRQEPA